MSRSRIVFLDAATLDYGDISLKNIRSRGIYTSFDLTKPRDLHTRIAGADIVITNKCILDRKAIQSAPSLKMIAVAATGVNNVDIESAKKAGIAVSNVSGYSTDSVAQWTLFFILSSACRFTDYHSVTKRKWPNSPMFTLADFPWQEVRGKTVGIIGYGRIGKKVAALAKAFSMNVLVGSIPGRKYTDRIKRSSLKRLYNESDFICLHAALTPATKQLINADSLKKMKPTATLINMARGDLVDEKALTKALAAGQIASAACDVLSQEPPDKKSALLKAPNLILTPHIAWASREARQRLADEIALNIEAFKKNKRRNRIV